MILLMVFELHSGVNLHCVAIVLLDTIYCLKGYEVLQGTPIFIHSFIFTDFFLYFAIKCIPIIFHLFKVKVFVRLIAFLYSL